MAAFNSHLKLSGLPSFPGTFLRLDSVFDGILKTDFVVFQKIPFEKNDKIKKEVVFDVSDVVFCGTTEFFYDVDRSKLKKTMSE